MPFLIELFYYMINQFRRLLQKMNDNQKRVLRERKHHNYLATQIVDGQTLGYARPGYSKEHVSPAVDLNANAKSLVKFINQVNKKLKEHEMKPQGEEAQRKAVEQPNIGNRQGIKETYQTTVKGIKPTIKNNNRRIKEHAEYRPVTEQNPEPTIHMEAQKWPGVNLGYTLPANINSFNGNFLLEINPMRIGYNSSYQPYKNEMELTKQLQLAQRAKLHEQIRKKQALKDKVKVKPQQKNEKNKLFGRSAYHIAIAYHIHLEKLKKQDKQNTEIGLEELDPTYYSKKLKQRSRQEIQEQHH